MVLHGNHAYKGICKKESFLSACSNAQSNQNLLSVAATINVQIGALVPQWVKRWPGDLGHSGLILTGGGNLFNR